MELRDIFDKMRSGESTPEGDEIKQRADEMAAKNDKYAPRDPKTGEKLPQEAGVEYPQEFRVAEGAALSGNPVSGLIRGTAGAITNNAVSGIKQKAADYEAQQARRPAGVQQDVIRNPELAELAAKPGGVEAVAARRAASDAESRTAFNRFKQNNEKYTSDPDKVSSSELNYLKPKQDSNTLDYSKMQKPTSTGDTAETLDYGQLNSTKSNTDNAPSLNYKDILAADAAKKASMKNIKKPD